MVSLHEIGYAITSPNIYGSLLPWSSGSYMVYHFNNPITDPKYYLISPKKFRIFLYYKNNIVDFDLYESGIKKRPKNLYDTCRIKMPYKINLFDWFEMTQYYSDNIFIPIALKKEFANNFINKVKQYMLFI